MLLPVNTHFGIGSVHTNPSPETPIQREDVLGEHWGYQTGMRPLSALILGSQVPTPTPHREPQIQRWKVLERHWRYRNRLLLHFHYLFWDRPCDTNPSPRTLNKALTGAGKGNGETKTGCYYLFGSVQLSLWDRQGRQRTLHRGVPIQRCGVLGKVLVIPKRSATTC